MNQLPDPQSLVELANAFEQLQGRRLNPAEEAHRRRLEDVVVRLAGVAVLALLTVCSWIAIDPAGRYSPEQRQQGLQGLGGVAAALVGAVAGYSAHRRG